RYSTFLLGTRLSGAQYAGTTLESTHRRLWCPKCGTFLDRDENAARNLAARGLRFSPNGPPGEAMVEEREPENATLILKVDGGKLSQSTDEDLTEPKSNT